MDGAVLFHSYKHKVSSVENCKRYNKAVHMERFDYFEYVLRNRACDFFL